MITGTPWRSKLIPYEKEITKMWKDRKTLKEIQSYLEEQKIKITIQGISCFLKVRRENQDPHRMPYYEANFSDHVSTNIKPGAIPKKQEDEKETESANDDEMERLRKKLEKKAHADPMEGLIIRKDKK